MAPPSPSGFSFSLYFFIRLAYCSRKKEMKKDDEQKLRLSLSVRGYDSKPSGNEVGQILFRKSELTAVELFESIRHGHASCYLFSAHEQFGLRDKRKENYIGTQTLFYDFDKVEESVNDFVGHLKFRPSFSYSTYSDGTDGRHSFRLVYCFEGIIYGMENFEAAYRKIADLNGFSGLLDARAANQLYYGTTSTADTDFTGYIYSPADFGLTLHDTPHGTDTGVSDVVYDFRSKSIGYFLSSHAELALIHQQVQESALNDTGKGYLTYPEHYYKVAREWSSRWMDGELVRKKKRVPKGERKLNLFVRGMVFKTNKPDITYPELLYCLTYEVYHFFHNEDGKIDKKVIEETAKGVLRSDSTVQESSKGKFRVDKEYWTKHGITVPEARGMIKKILNKEEFYNHYNSSMSVADNIAKFQDEGYRISKSTVYRYLKEDNLLKGQSVSQSKDNNNNINTYNDTEDPIAAKVLEAIRNNATATIPEIARTSGVSEKTVKRRISQLKADGRLIREGGKAHGKWVVLD